MLYLFNTTIMPNEGVYVNRKVSLEQVKDIFFNFSNGKSLAEGCPIEFTSAIGHQGTVDAFNTLFPMLMGEVKLNRIQATMQPGDQAIVLKVTGRLLEGVILTLEELQSIGFEFFHVQMVMEITENPIAFTCEMGGSKNQKTFTAFGECKF